MNNVYENNILCVRSLNKKYSNIQAVNNVTFAVEQGDIFAFIGPNGAGKTTTIRIILDIINSDSGTVEWNLNGIKNLKPESYNIGYLPEERGLYLDIPILKSLIYLASIRGMEKSMAKKSAVYWLERLDLMDRAKEKLQVLSKGNQQKIQFIASILHKPSFAILDEPFSGLDPLNQEKFIDLILEIKKQGTTILLSAHQMSLIEKIANKVFLINKGTEVYNGSMKEIYQTYGENINFDLTFSSSINKSIFLQLTELESLNIIDDYNASIAFKKHKNMNEILLELSKLSDIKDVKSNKITLHDIFLKLVNHQQL